MTSVEGSDREPTTLIFSSLERGRFYPALEELAWNYGARIDQRFTRYYADRLLQQYFDEEAVAEDPEARSYQAPNGGIALLPYSDDSLPLSAIFATLAHNTDIDYDQEGLKAYFRTSLKDQKADRSRVILALYGLSAYREPVLITLQNLIADLGANPQASPLTPWEKLNIAYALTNLGAKEDARQFYAKEIQPLFVQKDPYTILDKFQNQDDVIVATGFAAALAATLDEPQADGLGRYVIEEYPKETLKNFQLLLYLDTVLPKLGGGDVSFTYATSKQQGEKTLKRDEVFRLVATPEELQTLRFSKINGRISLMSSYEEIASPESLVQDSNIQIASRRYTVNGKETTSFQEGDLVRIEIIPSYRPGALSGAYQVVDYLPSGLRAVTKLQGVYTSPGACYSYPAAMEDQRISFLSWKDSTCKVINYYARVVTKGTYKAEQPLIQSTRSVSSVNVGSSAAITIR